MEQKKWKLNKKKTIMLCTILLSVLVVCVTFAGKLFPFTTLGAATTNIAIETELEKYVNYYLSDQDKGTLIQYNLKTKMEYGEEVLPVNEGQIVVNLGQINGQYPYDVKVITDDKTEYDANTGTLFIQSNQKSDATYVVIGYYDTYTENNDERELQVKVSAKAILDNQSNTEVTSEQQYNTFVTQNIGKLTSVHWETQDIYNGYLKSNAINGTNYTTQYEQIEEIMISKKEAQESIEMLENNIFMKGDMDLGNNNNNLIYKSTQIQKAEIERLLGEEGIVEIFDTNGNIIARIDQSTECSEDGIFTITYENELGAIIIKTSHIMNEGTLHLKHTKEIKSTIPDIQNIGIKTAIQMSGREDNYEIINEVKEAETNVNVNISSTNWTNEQQNELTFDIQLDASTVKNNLFKNPCIAIELPSQVEKVILGDSSIFYANGLELQEPYITTNENGKLVIMVNLTEAQTQYNENDLGLITDVKISSTVILNKNVESTQETVNVVYTNQYTLDGNTETGNKEILVQVTSYQEKNYEISEPSENNEIFEPSENEQEQKDETIEQAEDKQQDIVTYDTPQTKVNNNDLKLEVEPIKGDTILKDGDVVYEGEYIKYNIKVTNTSNEDMNDVKVVASIPNGVTYGELKTNYYDYRQAYNYNFDEQLKEKTIDIGTVKAGKSTTTFYEVKVNDLGDGQESSQIVTNIDSYVGQEQAQSYEITNKIEPAEVQLFMGSYIDYGGNSYDVTLVSEMDGEVEVKVHLPEAFILEQIICCNRIWLDIPSYEPDGNERVVYTISESESEQEQLKIEVSDDNVITTRLKTNCTYTFSGQMDRSKIKKQPNETTAELTSYVESIVNDKIYTSNENRVEISYNNIKVFMTSDNEGEKVKYAEEINYQITIQNLGSLNVSEDEQEQAIDVHVLDFLPEEVTPISVSYNTWKTKYEDKGEDEEEALVAVGYEETYVTEDIDGEITDENGNKTANVDCTITIPEKETVTVEIKTMAGFVYQETEIENSATISEEEDADIKVTEGGEEISNGNIPTYVTNSIKHIILPYDYKDDANDSEKPNDSQDSNVPDESNNQNKIDDLNNADSRYSISGIAWVDENEDGKRQSEETLLEGITVMLVDMADSSTVKSTTKTSNNGSYQFSSLEKGNYLVVFKYNTGTYQLAEYQKSGVSSSLNSDAISKTVTLYGEQILVGVTDTIELNESVTNIDIGLMKNQLCDFKIDKYISKVTVKTTKGTKEYTYNNANLVKTEIKAKEIEGAIVSIEYKVVITNVGERIGTVDKIIDYLPDGLSYSSNGNTNWVKNTNGELINTSLSNRKIAANESVELTLIATKQMTANATGTYTNKIEITDGNSENNMASADVIISVSTGAIMYITIVIFILIILGFVLVYLYKKGKIKNIKFSKITFLAMFLIIISLAGFSNAWSLSGKMRNWNKSGYWDFTWYQLHCFWGGPTGEARCMDHKLRSINTVYNYLGIYASKKTNQTTTSSGDFTLEKTEYGGSKTIEENGVKYVIYGPYGFACIPKKQNDKLNISYSLSVRDNKNQGVSYTMCNEDGRTMRF